ncbi:MAG TPA: hypothetical protein VNF27_10665 [Candidatus Binataceae bacterium]|nr:hypothetical protein [Candidatus Binataceae bacterium]
MKRHLYAIMATVGVAAIVIAAMVSGAIAQTMGEYGAATAATSTGTGTAETGPLDTHLPETVWIGATQFPSDNQQLSDKSAFPDTDRFGSNSDFGSSDRFNSADRFSSTSSLDSEPDRFDSGDRWSQDRWGK